LGHNIEHKLNKLVKESEKQFLLLNWLLAFNEEFIPNILFTSLLKKIEKNFKEKNENVHLLLPICDFLDLLNGLKEIGFVSGGKGFCFSGEFHKDYTKINNFFEIYEFINKEYPSDIDLMQRSMFQIR
jgi:hypothetical protein